MNVISSSTSFVPVDSLPRSSNGFINYLLLNVRSLLSKINDLSALPLMDSFDIVAMTETWLNDDFSDSELQRDGYNIFGFDRANRRGGGVLLAINSRLSCNRRCDLDLGVEMLVFEIHTRGSRCLIFSVFYRPQMQMRFSWTGSGPFYINSMALEYLI